MENIPASKAAKLLGISTDALKVLEKQGLIRGTHIRGRVSRYSSQDIARIQSQRGPTVAEEAAQVAIGIERKIASSVTSTRKVLKLAGGVLAGYALLVVIFAVLFIVSPLHTAQWLGLVRPHQDVSSTQAQSGKRVLGITTGTVLDRNSPLQTVLQPIGQVSLGIVKSINPTAYAQVSKVAILDANDVLTLDSSGTLTPQRPMRFPDSALLQVGNSELVANLNAEYLQGKHPGTNPGDLAIVGEASVSSPLIPSESASPTIFEATSTTPSGLVSKTSARQADFSVMIDTSDPLSGGEVLSNGETLTLSCPTCALVAASLFTTSSADTFSNKTISGLANTLVSIANASLLNSGLTFVANTGLSDVSLGETLTILGDGINTAASSGGIITLTGTETDTLAAVTGRGAVTATELTLNAGVTTTTTTNLTLDSGTTGGVSIGTGAYAKTVTLGNTTGTTAVNINSGTGNISFTIDGSGSSGKVQIGNSGTATPDLLVFDNGTADPTGVNGGVYYNSSTGKLRCYQGSAWTDCIGATGDSSVFKGKPTDQSVTSNTTLTSDTALTFSVGSGQTWAYNYELYITNNSSAQPDLKIAILGASGWTCSAQMSGLEANGSTFPQIVTTDCDDVPTAMANSIIGSDGGKGITVHVMGTITTTSAGSIILQFAQNTSSINAITIKAGSFVSAFRTAGSDVAEIYYSQESLMPGTIVSVDPDMSAGVIQSSGEYDKNLLGVVSTRPGLIIGDSNIAPGGIPAFIALSGRVPVRVSTENGAINVGDYLTSSSIPGVAMKATRSGAVIGMALAPYSGTDIGSVLIFVKNSVPELSLSNRAISFDDTSLLQTITEAIAHTYKNLVEFFDTVIFYGDVNFLGRLTFGKDAAGHVSIQAGNSKVSVSFDKAYTAKPVVTASMNLTGDVKRDDIPTYAIYDLSPKGFKIKLSKDAPTDLDFSWIALLASGSPDERSITVDAPQAPFVLPADDEEFQGDFSSDHLSPDQTPVSNESVPPPSESEIEK